MELPRGGLETERVEDPFRGTEGLSASCGEVESLI